MTKSPHKLQTLPSIATAEWRRERNRESVRDLWAYKEAHGLSEEALAHRLRCSPDSIGRYLDEEREVPGPIVRELISWRMAKEAA